MADNTTTPPESDFPRAMGRPATNALHHLGYYRLEQLTTFSEADLLKIHGIGPKAVRILQETLQARGLAFAPNPSKKSKGNA